MQYIERKKYLKRIVPFIDKQLIKVITGLRRSGKSFLLYQIMDYIKQNNPKANIIYINKEDLRFDHIKTYQDLYQYVKSQSEGKLNYVFIDEVQDIEEFEKAVRSLLSENFDIYITGSNSKLLSGDLATYLSGRYVEFNIHPLSYQEFLLFHNLEDTDRALQEYLKFGGMPFLIHLEKNSEVIYDYLQNLYNTVFFKDIVSRFRVRQTAFLGDLIKFLASNVGNLLSATSIAKYLKSQNIKISTDVVLNYIEYLTSAFVVRKVKRIDLEGKKIFQVNNKVYFEDIGIRNAVTGFSQKDIHKLIENIVFNHLVINGYSVYVGQGRNFEIDFVAEKMNERIYVQATYLLSDEATIEREFGNLLKIEDNYPKFVVSLDTFRPSNTYKGIKSLHLREFLMLNL